jgi:hypothetical protein
MRRGYVTWDVATRRGNETWQRDGISTGPSADPSENTNFYGKMRRGDVAWQTWMQCYVATRRGDVATRRRDVATRQDVSSVPRNVTQHGAKRLKNARLLAMLKGIGFYLSSSICPNHCHPGRAGAADVIDVLADVLDVLRHTLRPRTQFNLDSLTKFETKTWEQKKWRPLCREVACACMYLLTHIS